ncbi:glycoside hydrolase family 32 protein [Robiginitalea sp. SC105]|uniref:glycoside hydrolase family 32 protein n=1 Tax=Robiginitalea sp. SC105 TaxID=2762332 RepID=UPI00163B4861|nr:glycoside hydrolase family 32 protein [Robiginitalea sp. SC105]MBC2839548.1 glycoside hydrolase family 32 protein [Robiginitalea sp. SC105]
MTHLIRPMLFLMTLLLASCGEGPDNGKSASSVAGGDAGATRYDEPHRPQFHFTPSEAWMNDPNGMFYLEGEYHLSYQYYPDSTVWGPMHWGHAVSTDLLHWEEQPIALYPDSLGYIFSGSAVVDELNTSGFGNGEDPPVVAVFTYHDPQGEQAGADDFQYQGIAYSTDKGRTWTKYPGNPVLRNDTGVRDFRDPKVFWHRETERWVMVLAVYDRVMLYGSPDLKNWEYLSEFGIKGDTRLWECPDLFRLRQPGSRESKWVLLVSIQQEGPAGGTGTSYFVGDFDGTTFAADPASQKWLDYGADNYAFVTWDNAPVGWGNRLGIGWMSNWQYAQEVPTQAWRSAMTVPRVLSLVEDAGGYVISSVPVPAVTGLRGQEVALPVRIGDSLQATGDFSPSQCDLSLLVDLENTTATAFGCTLSNPEGDRLVIRFDREQDRMTVDRTRSGPRGFSEAFFKGPHSAPVDMGQESLDLRILLDVASVEVFADRGKANLTDIFFPESPYSALVLWAEGGELVLFDGSVYPMESIWEPRP